MIIINEIINLSIFVNIPFTKNMSGSVSLIILNVWNIIYLIDVPYSYPKFRSCLLWNIIAVICWDLAICDYMWDVMSSQSIDPIFHKKCQMTDNQNIPALWRDLPKRHTSVLSTSLQSIIYCFVMVTKWLMCISSQY